MSLYLVLFFVCAICAFFGFNAKTEKLAYAVSFLLTLGLLVFRYGQGTDWLAYNYIFESAPRHLNFSSVFYSSSIHSEFGWKLINNIWKALGFDFISLSMISALLEMTLFNKFINRYSTNRALSIFISLPVVYFTYFFSALRQGVVIAVFLGYMVTLLEKNAYCRYSLVALLLCFIHSISILFFIVPFINKVNIKHLSLLITISVVLGFIFLFGLRPLISLLGFSYESSSISWLAIMYRALMFFLILFLYSGIREMNPVFDFLFKIYCFGFCIYLILCSNQISASRLASPFLAVEIALVPSLIRQQIEFDK